MCDYCFPSGELGPAVISSHRFQTFKITMKTLIPAAIRCSLMFTAVAAISVAYPTSVQAVPATYHIRQPLHLRDRPTPRAIRDGNDHVGRSTGAHAAQVTPIASTLSDGVQTITNNGPGFVFFTSSSCREDAVSYSPTLNPASAAPATPAPTAPAIVASTQNPRVTPTPTVPPTPVPTGTPMATGSPTANPSPTFAPKSQSHFAPPRGSFGRQCVARPTKLVRYSGLPHRLLRILSRGRSADAWSRFACSQDSQSAITRRDGRRVSS